MKRAAIAFLFLVGCSSAEPAATPDGGNQAVFGTTGATGVYGDRSASCDRVVAALKAKAAALGCSLAPEPACPAMVDQLELSAGLPVGSCVQYDLGTIDNCEQRIATYTTCNDFASKACQIGLRKCSGTTTDAGTDAAMDAATDVATDSAGEGG
jgi:hypothetical protein